jgi:inner membrane protein
MPLPLGHLAIGLATHELSSNRSAFSRWKLLAAILVLSNLPDIDVVFGLLLQWNGSAFHRGPTHSLLFAGAMGLLAARAARIWSRLPQLGFWSCFALVLSHVAADALLSASAVSFFWPLETHWSIGHSGWQDVFDMVLMGNAQDAWIILGAAVLVMSQRTTRSLHAARMLRLHRKLSA